MFSLCALCLLPCRLGSLLRPHLSVISFHLSVLSPLAFCHLVLFLCCLGSLFCHLGLLLSVSFCPFIAVSCYFYSVFIACQHHALIEEDLGSSFLHASGRSKKETCHVSASIVSLLSVLPFFKLLIL